MEPYFLLSFGWKLGFAAFALAFLAWSLVAVGKDTNAAKYPQNGKPSEVELDEIEIEISK